MTAVAAQQGKLLSELDSLLVRPRRPAAISSPQAALRQQLALLETLEHRAGVAEAAAVFSSRATASLTAHSRAQRQWIMELRTPFLWQQ